VNEIIKTIKNLTIKAMCACGEELQSEVMIEPSGGGYFIIVKDCMTENRIAVTLEELGMLFKSGTIKLRCTINKELTTISTFPLSTTVDLPLPSSKQTMPKN
jgi:hypothetical protein